MDEQTQNTKRVAETLYSCGGDMSVLKKLLHKDLVLHEPPFLPYGGAIRGFDAFLQIMGEAAKYLDTAKTSVENIVADGNIAIARVRIPAIGGGEALMLDEMRVEDGRIVELRIFFNDVGSMPLPTVG